MDYTQKKLIGNLKSVSQFDSFGNEILSALYRWNTSTNSWVETSRYERVYNGNSLLKETRRWWDQDTGELRTGSIEEYAYNGSKIDYCVHSSWQGSEGWKVQTREDYIYSGSFVTEKIHSAWITWKEDWSKSTRYAYTNDAFGRVLIEDTYSISDENLTGRFFHRAEYAYDSNGRVIFDSSRFYDANTGWDPHHQYEVAYDAAGQEVLRIACYWNSGVITSSSKTERIFDENKNMTFYARYTLDSAGNWVGQNKEERAYDIITQQQTSFIYYLWDSSKSDWVVQTKSLTEFDSKGNYLSWEYNNWDNASNNWIIDYKSKLEYVYNKYDNPDTDSSYDWDGSKFVYGGISKYYYGDKLGGGTGIEETPIELVHVYPNPASDYIMVNLSTDSNESAVITIMDINGRVCLKNTIISGQPLSVANLAGGIYFYQIKDTDKTYNGKLIIK